MIADTGDTKHGEVFVCALCKQTFNKGRSDEEAMKETRQYFGDVDISDCDIICDDCWKRIMPEEKTP